MPKLDQMSEKDIRTEMLYNKNDPVKLMILQKRLQQIILSKKRAVDTPSKQKSEVQSIRSQKAKSAPSPTKLTPGNRVSTRSRSPREKKVDDYESILQQLMESERGNEEMDDNASQMSEDDLSFLEDFIDYRSDEGEIDPENYQPEDPRIKGLVARDFLNNKMTDRMNSDIDIRNSHRRQRFVPPFEEADTGNYAGVNDPQHWSTEHNFSNQNAINRKYKGRRIRF